MIMYFAGGECHHKSLYKWGTKNILVSAYGLGYKRDITEINKKFDKVLLDSGGYTARMKGISIKVKDYAKYINDNKIKLAFNLDVLDEKESKYNQQFLETETESYILPVYHYSDYAKKEYRGLLDEMIEKYPYISIGGIAGERLGSKKEVFYDYVFKKIGPVWDKCKIHGLGITGKKVLNKYPFYSVDSTSWLSFQKYGSSKAIKNKLLEKFHTKKTHYLKRDEMEIQYYKEMETYITRLWKKRGIAWND
tara:strand:- start:85 stop:834 length:750 start_codon:yes stop_codon:yes gene_type:complete